MSNQDSKRQILLGVFFVAALSILAFYTLFLTDIHVFSKPILMTVYFPDANGLREGDSVQVLGAKFGRVRELTYDSMAEPKKRIRTVLSLDKELELTADGTISIRESSFLGGRHVDINPGTYGGPPKEALEDGSYLGDIYKNPIAMLGDIGALLNENRAAINGFLTNLDAITSDLRAGQSLLSRLIVDPQMGADANRFVANMGEASDKLKQGEGLLGALIYDPSLKESVTATLDRVEKIGADLENQTGVLGSLIYDSTLRDRFSSGIDSFVSFGQKLDRGEGALGLLLSDPATKAKVETLVTNLAQTSEDIKLLVADARAGRGTLGKLLADDGLYQEAEKAVALLTRSLEDYREAAPITSFTSVLFAGF